MPGLFLLPKGALSSIPHVGARNFCWIAAFAFVVAYWAEVQTSVFPKADQVNRLRTPVYVAVLFYGVLMAADAILQGLQSPYRRITLWMNFSCIFLLTILALTWSVKMWKLIRSKFAATNAVARQKLKVLSRYIAVQTFLVMAWASCYGFKKLTVNQSNAVAWFYSSIPEKVFEFLMMNTLALSMMKRRKASPSSAAPLAKKAETDIKRKLVAASENDTTFSSLNDEQL